LPSPGRATCPGPRRSVPWRGPRRQPGDRVRSRSVQQPQRDGRMPERPGRGTDHRTGEPLARHRSSLRSSARSTTDRRAAASDSVRLEPNDTQPIVLDWLFEGAFRRPSNTATCSAPTIASPPSSSDTTRSDAARMGRDRRHANRDATRHVGVGATTPGACATASANPSRTWNLRALGTTTSSGHRAISNDLTARPTDLHGVQPLPQAWI
jgi:hypothetical protein